MPKSRWKRLVGSVLLSTSSLAACAEEGPPPRTVHQEDVTAWSRRPRVELETHALFATIPKTVRQNSDGSEIWDFANCRTLPSRCQAASAPGFAGTQRVSVECEEAAKSCCHNVFLVKDAEVVWYRPKGNCYTDCSVRPAAAGGC